MEKPEKKHKRSLIFEVQFKSVLLYFISILVVQIALIFVIVSFLVADGNKRADTTIKEAAQILVEPLYNVDDDQAVRLGNTYLSSGRIAGIVIDTSANGIILSQVPDAQNRWIPVRTQAVYHKGFFLGTISLYFSEEEIIRNVEGFILIVGVVLLTLFGAIILSNMFFVTGNLRGVVADVSSGINEIAAGNYAWEIPLSGYDDIDSLIFLLNNMAGKVRTNDKELRRMNTMLEERVAERTQDLAHSLSELKNMQERLVESGKLSALGQLSAGIAHELNTPLGAIISSVSSMVDFFDSDFIPQLTTICKAGESDRNSYFYLLQRGIEENRELVVPSSSYRTLKSLEGRLKDAGIPSPQRVASCLVDAGLHQDIDVLLPLLENLQSLDYLSVLETVSLSRRMLTIIQESALKATSVIEALRSYLIHDVKTETQVVEIDKSINQVLIRMHNLLKHGIKIETSLQNEKVLALHESLSLVWINLIRNAAQAMDYRGTLTITVTRTGGRLDISFRDTGHGIPADIIDRIFEPFFTTKHSGEGMGLGLDICKRIIESYEGTITASSNADYTEFLVSFPAYIG